MLPRHGLGVGVPSEGLQLPGLKKPEDLNHLSERQQDFFFFFICSVAMLLCRVLFHLIWVTPWRVIVVSAVCFATVPSSVLVNVCSHRRRRAVPKVCSGHRLAGRPFVSSS